ncbi:MAG: hypothetical protein WD468_08345 [Pirellulales bacterium]
MTTRCWKLATVLALSAVCAGLGGPTNVATAAFTATGVYDESSEQTNAVDVEAVSNNISLIDLSALVGNAYDADLGGVLTFNSADRETGTTGFGASDVVSSGTGSTQINVKYGTSLSKTLVIIRQKVDGSASAVNFSTSNSASTDITHSISGDRWLGSASGEGSDFRLTFSEPLTAFGITALYRPVGGSNSPYTVDMVIGLSDDSTFTFDQEQIVGVEGGGPGDDDTFFGYQAPTGVTIDYVQTTNAGLARWDDLGFVTAALLALPGDFNADSAVDAADYVLWRKTLGTSFDLNGNGDEAGDSMNIVDGADYELWRSRFGDPSASEASAEVNAPVPEPATWLFAVLLLLGAFFLSRWRCVT